MNQYLFLTHLLPEEIGKGTMVGNCVFSAESDEKAWEYLSNRGWIASKEYCSEDWNVENKEFSLVRLVKP